jgi:hypothetical protein
MEDEKKPLENGFYKMTHESQFVNYMSVKNGTALRLFAGQHYTMDMAMNYGFDYYQKIEKIDRKVFLKVYKECIKNSQKYLE